MAYIFSEFVEILQKSFKVFSRKNVKLVPSVILIFLLLISILLVANIFSVKPYLADFVFKLSTILVSPSSVDFANLLIPIKYDLRIIATIQWINAVASSTTSLLFATATILSSSAAHRGKDLHLKHLVSCVVKLWKRPFVTFFYTTLLDFGYVLFVLTFVLPFVLIFEHKLTMHFVLPILILIPIALLYFYLAVVWTLAIVVSVLEEKSGIEALGKAGQIVKGLKLKGFLLKLFFGALYCALLILLRMTNERQSVGTKLCVFLLFVNSICFLKMFSLIAYTVFYHECMKMHGEEVSEIQGTMEYTETGSTDTPLITAKNIA